jgi:hypothetical protein
MMHFVDAVLVNVRCPPLLVFLLTLEYRLSIVDMRMMRVCVGVVPSYYYPPTHLFSFVAEKRVCMYISSKIKPPPPPPPQQQERERATLHNTTTAAAPPPPSHHPQPPQLYHTRRVCFCI